MAPRRPPQHLRSLLLSLVVCAHALLCTPAVSKGGGALRGQACAQHLRRTGAVTMGFFSDMTNAVTNFGDELDRFIVRQHGQSAVLAVPEVGSCTSSGRVWRLWAARHSQGEARPPGAQPMPAVVDPHGRAGPLHCLAAARRTSQLAVMPLHVEPTSKLSARCVSAALSCVRGSCVRVTGRCESSQAEPASELSARRVSAELSCVCRPRAQDDAAGRRLGNGAKFYGKRRSPTLWTCSHRVPQPRRTHGARAPASCGVRT